eukprot:5694409-Heterocapsa_arctica.AAC.1
MPPPMKPSNCAQSARSRSPPDAHREVEGLTPPSSHRRPQPPESRLGGTASGSPPRTCTRAPSTKREAA